MSDFARALTMEPPSLTKYLNGSQRPGFVMQERLRELGCDIEWLMTGKKSGDRETERLRQENARLKKQLDDIRLRLENALDPEFQKKAEMVLGEFDAIRRSLSSQVLRVILETTKKADAHRGKDKKRLRSESADSELPQ